MHHQQIASIDDKARVWIVTRGPDGKLQEQLDPALLGGVGAGQPPEDLAALVARLAGTAELAPDRVW